MDQNSRHTVKHFSVTLQPHYVVTNYQLKKKSVQLHFVQTGASSGQKTAVTQSSISQSQYCHPMLLLATKSTLHLQSFTKNGAFKVLHNWEG